MTASTANSIFRKRTNKSISSTEASTEDASVFWIPARPTAKICAFFAFLRIPVEFLWDLLYNNDVLLFFGKGGHTVLNRRTDRSRKKSVSALFTDSVILRAMDSFLSGIYRRIKDGFFGRIFSAYPKSAFSNEDKPRAGRQNPLRRRVLLPIRRAVSVRAEQSFFLDFLRRLIAFFLRCRLRVYGTFLLTFGVYTAAAYLLSLLGTSRNVPFTNLIVAAVLMLSSTALITVNTSLSDALLSSAIAPHLCAILGIRQKSIRASGLSGRSDVAFIAGMIAGLLTYIVPVLNILIAFIGVFLLFRIFMTPELGVSALFLLMPFLPTMVLAGLLIYTALCFGVKLLLGKRQIKLETVDLAAMLFAFVILLGGVFSFSPGSLKPSLLLCCFIGGYFLTVLLCRTEEWLSHCTGAAIFSASIVSLYGILQYFTGSIGEAGAWLDTEMFEDISGRVVSTLENPNMLAEYLILLLPLAVCRLLTRGTPAKRTAALCASALMGVCLILTWSRGAWLGLIFGALIFLLIWSRRSLYLIFAGVVAVPFLPFVLPDSIISRFTSIGNLADTSTSYRLNIWRGAVHMLEDYWHCGIGIGEAAWDTVYPRYSLAAIEAAPHAHNLYLQTWIECGIAGIALLLLFLFFLCQSNFSFYRSLSDMRKTIVDSISVTHLKPQTRTTSPAAAVRDDRTDRIAAEGEITALRLNAAAPLCGLFATLVQGLTDYTWYNYRVFLMFWLVAGLSAAYARLGQKELSHIRNVNSLRPDSPDEAQTDLAIAPALSRKKRKGTEKGAVSHG